MARYVPTVLTCMLLTVLALHAIMVSATLRAVAAVATEAVRAEAALSLQVAILEQRLEALEKREKVMRKRQDLLTAATRMGWVEAYRFVREGGLDWRAEQ